MKTLATIFMFLPAIVIAQGTINDLKPYEIQSLNLSNEEASKFENNKQTYTTILKKMESGKKFEELSEEERRVLKETDETMEDYWDIIGGGCSWYCGGGPEKVTASSQLKMQGTNSYVATNAHDLSYKTAWVEGATGSGLGEFLQYTFSAASPRITDVIIVNGYIKSEKAYFDNSRAKKIKLYLNDKPIAILVLEDQRSKQSFKFEPIGNNNRDDLAALKGQPGWTLKFEILEVYKGLKYDDVAITEIFFDGLDVH